MKISKLLAIAWIASAGFASGAWAADKPKLEFWTMSLKPKFTAYFETLVQKYNAQNPNVEVVWVDYPWDVIQSKFTTAVASGQPPALVQLNVPWAYEYAREGLLQPVDNVIDKSLYVDGAIKDVTFNGKTYGFPHYNGANVIAYNTELFRKAGLNPNRPPRSFEQELQYAKVIREKTGVAGFAPALGPTKIEGIMIQQGLDIVKDGKAVFNSPKHVEFVRKLADAYKAGALLKDNLFAQDNFQTSMAAYNAGRLAMLESTPPALTRVRDDAPDIYKVTEVGGAPLGPTKIAAGGWMFHFAVAKNVPGKLLPDVGKLASYLTSHDAQLEFSKLAGTLPTAKRTARDPFFRLPPNAGAVEKGIAEAVKNLDYTRTIYLAGVPDAEALGKKLADAVEAAITGRKDAQAALDEAAAFWNQRLAKQ